MWKLALHSVSYAGAWEGQAALPVEEFIDHAADLGYQGVMLMARGAHSPLLDTTPDRRAALRERMQRRGLGLAAVAAYTDFTIAAERADIPVEEMQLLYVRECARLARDLGGSLVRIFSGYERSDLGAARCWSRCVRAVKECARQAAAFDVTLAVQNHHDVAAYPDALCDFLAEVDEPNVRAGYDAWAPALQGLSGEALAASVRRLGPAIAQTIVADYVRRPRFRYVPALTNYVREDDSIQAVPVGEGFIDYAAFFGALREAGYQGWVTYEMCSPLQGGGSLANLDRCARRFVEWMGRFA